MQVGKLRCHGKHKPLGGALLAFGFIGLCGRKTFQCFAAVTDGALCTTSNPSARCRDFTGFNFQRHQSSRKQLAVSDSIVAASSDGKESTGGDAPDVQLSTISETTINMAKNAIGFGVFSLPAGMAMLSGSFSAVGPLLAIMVAVGALCAYTASLIGEICEAYGASSYSEAWAKSLSPGSSWLVDVAVIGTSFIPCIAYSMVLGDCISLILAPLGLPAFLSGRPAVIVLLTLGALLPMCSLRSLAPLAKFSLLGLVSQSFSMLTVVISALNGSYRAGGRFFHAALSTPKFSTTSSGMLSGFASPELLIFIGMLFNAFACHYNVPAFYSQLKPDSQGSRVDPFRRCVGSSFALITSLCSIVAVAGFATFGLSAEGFILNSYAAADGLASAARLVLSLSLLFTYPVVFAGARQAIAGLCGGRVASMERSNPVLVTAPLLTVATLAAISLRDIGKLAAVVGSIFCSFVIVGAPPAMKLAALRSGRIAKRKGISGRLETVALWGMVPLTLAVIIVGTAKAL